MPNRIIRDVGLTSRKLAAASDFGERFYWRLYQAVDDFGRFHGDPRIIKGKCFSLMDEATLERIEAARDENARVGLIVLYRRGPDIFLQIIKFEQRRRCKASKFPPPDDRHVTVIRPSADGLDRGSRIEDRGSRTDRDLRALSVVGSPETSETPTAPPPLERPEPQPQSPPECVLSCGTCMAMLRELNDSSARAYTAPGRAGEWMHQAHAGRSREEVCEVIRREVTRLAASPGKSRFLSPSVLFKPENWETTVNDRPPAVKETAAERRLRAFNRGKPDFADA